LNVLLNLVLIPSHGAVGSAWATLVSYFAATFLVVAFPQGRTVNRHLVKAILFAKGG
jgi:Na+-driven multidrug efflux pump